MSADPYTPSKDAVGFSVGQPGRSSDATTAIPGAAPASTEPRARTGGSTPPTARPAPARQQAAAARQASLNRWERRRRVKLQARKVRRIIRYVSPWSVLRVSIIFFFFLWAACCVSVVVLWTAAERNGMITQIEELAISFFALDEFTIDGGYLFGRFAVVSLVFAVFGTMMSTLLCVVFNLISDLVGGIRLTVIEEESVRFRPPKRRVQNLSQKAR